MRSKPRDAKIASTWDSSTAIDRAELVYSKGAHLLQTLRLELGDDLLSRLLAARDEVDATRGMDDGQLRDEVMTLVGGSGSGKTQLLRVILGLKRPAGGRVRVLGVPWDGGDVDRA